MLKNILKSLKRVQKQKIITGVQSKKFYQQEISVVDLPLSAYFSGTPEPVSKQAAGEVVLQNLRDYEVTTLENGFTVQSTEFNQSGTTVLSLVVKAGSRYENYQNSGVSHFIQKFFFDSTNTRSKMRLVTEMQKTGATVSSSSDRENIIYRSESVREAVPKLLSLISDSVLQGRLHEYDLHPQRELVKQDLLDYAESPEVLLNEALHRTAFNGKNLGNPLICPSYNVNKISIDDIIQRMDTYFNPERMTLVGTNIHHDDLVYLSTRLFGEFPEGTGKNSDIKDVGVSEYTGGEYQMHQRRYSAVSPATHSVLAFRGLAKTKKDSIALEVLRNMLGDSKTNDMISLRTFGTQGLLSNHIVKKLPKTAGTIHEAAGFNINYSDDCLFGVKFSGDSIAVGEAIKHSLELFKVIADKGVCQMNLNRGKNKAKFNYYSNLETSVGVHESHLAYPNLRVEQLANGFDKITAYDIQRVAKYLLTSKPTLVSYGELENVPTLFDLSK